MKLLVSKLVVSFSCWPNKLARKHEEILNMRKNPRWKVTPEQDKFYGSGQGTEFFGKWKDSSGNWQKITIFHDENFSWQFASLNDGPKVELIKPAFRGSIECVANILGVY